MNASRRWVRKRPGSVWPITLFGFGVAAFLLVGRWTPAGSGVLWQPRAWIVLFISALAFGVWSPGVSRHRGLAQFALLFGAWIGASVLWSIDRELAFAKLFDLLLVAMAAWAVYAFSSRVPIAAASILGSVTLLLLALAALGVLSIALSGLARLSVLGGGPNVFGRNMALLAVLGFAVLLFRPRRSVQISAVAVAAVAGALVFASGSRGALVSLAAGVLFLIMTMRWSSSRRLLLSVVGGVVAAAAVVAVVGAAIWLLPGSTTEATISNRIGYLTLDQGYSTYRGDLFDRAVTCTIENPVAGAGLAGYAAQDFGVYPHNITAEVACEQGGIGLILLFALGGGFAIVVASEWNREVALITAVLVTWLVAAQFSGDLYDARGVFVLAALAVAVVDRRSTAATEDPTASGSRLRSRRSSDASSS